MKKLFAILVLLVAVQYGQCQATPITDTGALRTRINADIKANNTGSITGDKLNRILNGQLNVTQLLVTSKVDSAALADSLQAFVRLQTQYPTASLNDDSTYELHSAGTFTALLNYAAGRRAATETQLSTKYISTIFVNEVSKSFIQPNAGASVSGTAIATITYNTTTTISNVVTTTDGKVTTATRTITGLPNNYFGYSSSPTPDQTIIKAVAGGGNFLSTSRAYSPTVTIPSGSPKYPYYSYPSSQGDLTLIRDGAGNDITGAFTKTVVSVTNASGYTQNYNCYTLINNFSNTSVYVQYQ